MVATAAITLTASLGSATDGVIEINQARALVGGVTSGDTAGFPVLIDSAGSYRLTGNLIATPNAPAINISASDVTLDLNGFSISSSGSGGLDGVAVILGLAENIEVRNGTIRDFLQVGFSAGTCSGCRAIDMRLLDNGQAGVFLGSYSLVRGCTASGNGTVGLLVGASSSAINNVAHDNGSTGIYGLGGGGVIRNNLAYANTEDGIVSEGGTVIGNTTSGNGVDGIHIAVSAARVQGNGSTDNGDDGIQSNGVSGVSVTENVVTGNAYGLYIHPDTTIGGNTAIGNTTTNLGGGIGIRIACSNIGGTQTCP